MLTADVESVELKAAHFIFLCFFYVETSGSSLFVDFVYMIQFETDTTIFFKSNLNSMIQKM